MLYCLSLQRVSVSLPLARHRPTCYEFFYIPPNYIRKNNSKKNRFRKSNDCSSSQISFTCTMY